MNLASFDIFDTTLIRKCGRPENIFYLLANRLFPNDRALREEFLLWRRNAEQSARKRFPNTDVSLEQIYSAPELSSFSAFTPEQMQQEELRTEAENLTANPAIKAVIENKRKEGYTICFISDMYIDSVTLVNILKREGCLKDGEKVFVSCEYNARKSDGRLFDKVRNEMSQLKWIHYGDHKISDVKIPRNKGIKSEWVNYSFTETENRFIHQSRNIACDYELSILAGLQRAARICNGNNAYTEIAANFIAPAYIPYVLFVLNEAKERGLKRLYFLSRDSYILMKMAETVKADFPNIELKYLFVSRKSLLMPYLTEVTSEQFLAAQDHQTILSKNIDSLLKTLDTNREELQNEFGIQFDYNKISSKKQESDFLSKIFGKESPYLPILRQRCAARFNMLHAYFQQEGLFDGTPSGMVDVGWLGTSRLMINSILKHSGANPVEFFYFGVRGDVLPSIYGVYSSYFRPNQLSTELTALIENYYSASPYPSTLGYKKSGHTIVPTFAHNSDYKETPITENNISIATWIMQEMRETDLHFEPAFWTWTKTAINAISQLSVKIDLTPFVKTADFDDSAFVRKLSGTELIKLICLGDHITAFDRASLQLTTHRCCDKSLWRLHNFTGRLRRYLYLRLRK